MNEITVFGLWLDSVGKGYDKFAQLIYVLKFEFHLIVDLKLSQYFILINQTFELRIRDQGRVGAKGTTFSFRVKFLSPVEY